MEDLKSKVKFGIKFWLEFESNRPDSENKGSGRPILGSGWAKLLECLDKNEENSLTSAALECDYSYKYAWNILKRIEKRTGMSPVETGKGGRGGGGYVKLNEWGKYLLNTYLQLESEIKKLEAKIKQIEIT